MSHQSVPARLNVNKAPGPSPSSPISGQPVQSRSGICIKQEYFEDQLLMTRTIKTESSESPSNQHKIMDSIKVEVKEEHYDDQDCVVKCELDFDEGEQISRKIQVKVEDVSSGQPVQHFKCVKKEEEGGEYVMECDCKECEICRVKIEMKEEFDQSGSETEFGRNNVEGCTRVKKEEGEDDGEVETPNKIRRMDGVVGNVPIGSPSPSPTVYSPNVVSINVECLDDQVATSSTNSLTVEDHTQPSQPVTIPLSTQFVTAAQSSSSAQHVNEIEPLRDELLNGEPMMVNVVAVREEFDREQVDEDNSTLNRVHTDQAFEEYDEEEGDETTEQREDTSAADERQVPAESFVKRIELADELGNRFECDYRACGKRTKRKCDLIKHIRTHTGEKRYKCSVAGCDRAYFQKSNLDEHIRTHIGDRPFVCTWPDCGQAFARSSNLKTHSLVHSNERSFVCDVTGCTKVYKHKRTLRRHQNNQHNFP